MCDKAQLFGIGKSVVCACCKDKSMSYGETTGGWNWCCAKCGSECSTDILISTMSGSLEFYYEREEIKS